ncbi:serine/threonine protein kinase [Blastomyces dermatitidis ATCC 18188]|uniref:Serine/threonine protein kinase n=1 Tax=Ajellomyces dermatitidis (strain ATCC 18188 / CBS 674.68) TaxID=653446 RepID=F2TCR8_AJEDA|nr:serine/threonine protein kinase [Blastomyces dermatitidis ATCC 18188]
MASGVPVDVRATDDNSGDSNSEPELHTRLEVVFDQDAGHVRKSSIVSADTPRLSRRHADQRSDSACFVHALLSQPQTRRLGRVSETNETKDSSKLPSSQLDDSLPPRITQSRLLTKRQLSDMAWNVRALSKKLGSVKMKLDVKTVFILTKPQEQCLVLLTRRVARWLLSKDRDQPYTIYVEKRLEDEKEFDAAGLYEEEPSAKGRLKFWDLDLVKKKPQTFDFIVTLGGDGTVLYGSWLFQQVVPPVLSFALGSLGFLTNFDFEHYQSTLETAFRDGITVSLRSRFECTIMRSRPRPNQEGQRDLVEELIGEESDDDTTHRPDTMFQILNDVVIDRGPNPTMSSIEIFGDDEHFTSVQADGVCVATPTGSTAYNLAAGGSLSHPENPVILLTAICAHTLNFRPIILPDTIVLRVGVPYNARASSWAGFDGRERMELCPGDYVTISASRYPFACVTPSAARSHDWIQSISRTLNWNSRQKQKGYDLTKGCDGDKGKL